MTKYYPDTKILETQGGAVSIDHRPNILLLGDLKFFKQMNH